MTPEFAKKIDPIYLYVLGLLERIDRNDMLSVSDERVRIRGLIDRADADFGHRQDWQLAKYALVSWIDEMLIDVNWDGRKWWQENALEVEYFNSRIRATEFYAKAREASVLPKKDSLEVFYVCVVLGFRGIYRDPAAGELTEQLGYAPDLESWARKQAMTIQLGQGRPPITESPRPGDGAPPLEGKFKLVGASLIAACLAALNVIVAWLVFFEGK